jgi:hypothetical protein
MTKLNPCPLPSRKRYKEEMTPEYCKKVCREKECEHKKEKEK